MPGIGLGPPSGFGTSAPRALVTGGLAMAAFTAVVALVMRSDQSTDFAQPVAVDAVVIEQGLIRSGGATRSTCSPLYRFEWEGTTQTARPPTRQAASCVDEGHTVRILVDAANPTRVADPAAEHALRSGFLMVAGLAGAMMLLGALIAWKRRPRTR
jgi:hypothetical protein